MPPEPLVSVIIPVFNREDLISRAIESVLLQDYPDYEIILIDDASSDNTVEKINKTINEGRIRLIKLNKRVGPAIARNIGIDLAIGTLVAFLDSDDSWRPNKLSRQVEAVQSSLDPTNTMCYCRLLIKRTQGQEVRPSRAKGATETVGDYLFISDGVILSSTIMLPTYLAAKVRFRDEFRGHEDWDFCLRLGQMGVQFVMVDEPLATWYDDDRPDRISINTKVHESLAWLEEVSHLLSKNAYHARQLALINGLRIREGRLVLSILSASQRAGAIRFRTAAVLAAIWLIRSVYLLIRSVSPRSADLLKRLFRTFYPEAKSGGWQTSARDR